MINQYLLTIDHGWLILPNHGVIVDIKHHKMLPMQLLSTCQACAQPHHAAKSTFATAHAHHRLAWDTIQATIKIAYHG